MVSCKSEPLRSEARRSDLFEVRAQGILRRQREGPALRAPSGRAPWSGRVPVSWSFQFNHGDAAHGPGTADLGMERVGAVARLPRGSWYRRRIGRSGLIACPNRPWCRLAASISTRRGRPGAREAGKATIARGGPLPTEADVRLSTGPVAARLGSLGRAPQHGADELVRRSGIPCAEKTSRERKKNRRAQQRSFIAWTRSGWIGEGARFCQTSEIARVLLGRVMAVNGPGRTLERRGTRRVVGREPGKKERFKVLAAALRRRAPRNASAPPRRSAPESGRRPEGLPSARATRSRPPPDGIFGAGVKNPPGGVLGKPSSSFVLRKALRRTGARHG